MVLPSWITDSVERGELQPYDKYLLINQNRITDFFSSVTSPTYLSDEGAATAAATAAATTAEALEVQSGYLDTGQLLSHTRHTYRSVIRSRT